MIITMKIFRYICCVCAAVAVAVAGGCSEEVAQPDLFVTADRNEVSVGEPVTLTITHNVDGLSVYSGDAGHDWYKSAAYLLAGKSEGQLRDSLYRPLNPDVRPVEYDFSDAVPGEASIGKGVVQLLHSSMGTNLVPTEGEVVFDQSIGKNVLRVNSVHPEWWYQALRINLNTALGSNKTLTLKMRFAKEHLSEIASGAPRPDVPTFGVVVRLGGIPVGEEKVIFSEASVWDVYWAPSLGTKSYSVDLGRIVSVWQGATGKQMGRLAYAQILFTAVGSVGYVGEYYIEGVKYGDYDYAPWDTGEGLSVGLGPGTLTYTHTFTAPGEYEMVVAGTKTSLKQYSGSGYKENLGDKISADEYSYKQVTKSIKIRVK